VRLFDDRAETNAGAERSTGAADRNLGGAARYFSSPGELHPVLEAMLEHATASAGPRSAFCPVRTALIGNRDVGMTPAYAGISSWTDPTGPTTGLGPSASTRITRFHIVDSGEQVYAERDLCVSPPPELGGARTLLTCRCKQGELIRARLASTARGGPFTREADRAGHHFAHQAVIAIETRGCST